MNPSPPGYLTKQECIAVLGVDDLLIRSLLDKNQFHDPLDEALNLGISSAAWPLFGLLWPSGMHLAERMARRPVTDERILEIGCGLGLASLVAHRRGAQVTASDCHPLAHSFLDENARINGLEPMPYCHGLWGTAALREDGLPVLTQAHDSPLTGVFDLIVGSDILYTVRSPTAVLDGERLPGLEQLTPPFEFSLLGVWGGAKGRVIALRPKAKPRSLYFAFRGVRVDDKDPEAKHDKINFLKSNSR